VPRHFSSSQERDWFVAASCNQDATRQRGRSYCSSKARQNLSMMALYLYTSRLLVSAAVCFLHWIHSKITTRAVHEEFERGERARAQSTVEGSYTTCTSRCNTSILFASTSLVDCELASGDVAGCYVRGCHRGVAPKTTWRGTTALP